MKQWIWASEGTLQKGEARPTATPDPATFIAVVAAMDAFGSATYTSQGQTRTVCFCPESWNLDLQSHNRAVCFLMRAEKAKQPKTQKIVRVTGARLRERAHGRQANTCMTGARLRDLGKKSE